jgi:hypothetical protein
MVTNTCKTTQGTRAGEFVLKNDVQIEESILFTKAERRECATLICKNHYA